MKHKRERYQLGSLKIEARKNGPDVWVYRWREAYDDGSSSRRKRIIGTADDYRSKAAAQRAVDGLRMDVNATVGVVATSHTVAELIAHYTETELVGGRHTARVQQVYKHNLEDIILPRWGNNRLKDIVPIQVERWLDSLPYAPATRTKIKGVFGTLYRHGMRYQWASTNPIALVRCSSKRVEVPDILTPREILSIIGELSEPARTVTMLAAFTGMRRGELFGLKWEDLDFVNQKIRIVRSLVDQIEGKPKTEASRKPVSMKSEALAMALQNWQKQTSYAEPSDWVFASPLSFGKLPYWPDMMLRRHILPAAKRLEIPKRIGWHTFRRTAATLHFALGANVKTTQGLMRHATADITLELYAQALDEDMGIAQEKLANLILGAGTGTGETAISA